MAAAPPVRGAAALLCLACAVACAALIALGSRLHPVFAEQAPPPGGIPDQSRSAVLGDSAIDASWRGIWKRSPAAYAAVSHELQSYNVISAEAVPMQSTALAQGQAILNGYSQLLGTSKPKKRADGGAKEARARLYREFILRGGKKAQLYDAVTHDQELKAYGSVLSLPNSDGPAVDGPLGPAIESPKQELLAYKSILGFNSMDEEPAKKAARTVRSHTDVLAFSGGADDAERVKSREVNHHVLDSAAMAAERHAHAGILSFGADAGDARVGQATTSRRRHESSQSQIVKHELANYDSILDFTGHTTTAHVQKTGQQPAAHKRPLDLSGNSMSAAHAKEAISRRNPGFSGLNSESSHETVIVAPAATRSVENARATVIERAHTPAPIAGRRATFEHVSKMGSGTGAGPVTGARSDGAITAHPVRQGHKIQNTFQAVPSSAALPGKTVAVSEEQGQTTKLVDEALLQDENAILIEPPALVGNSPIGKKLAKLYAEASRLIRQETPRALRSTPSGSTAVDTPGASSTAMQAVSKRRGGESALNLRAPSTVQPGPRRGRVASRDPVLRRLRREAKELRARIRKTHEAKVARAQRRARRRAAEAAKKTAEAEERAAAEDALSHTISHKEKLLRLDERLQHRLTHTSKTIMKRADEGIATMISDDENKLHSLERAQARDKAARRQTKLKAEWAGQRSAAQKEHLRLERQHALLLAKIHELKRHLASSYYNGDVANKRVLAAVDTELGEGGARGNAREQELSQIDAGETARSGVLSPRDKQAYARQLARAEQLLVQARSMAQSANLRHDKGVAAIEKDLGSIALVLDERAQSMLENGLERDEELHVQRLRELVDAAVARANHLLGKRARGFGVLLRKLRHAAEQHPGTHVSRDGRLRHPSKVVQQRKEEEWRLARLRRAMRRLHAHGARQPPVRETTSLLKTTSAALERSGDYVPALHARPAELQGDTVHAQARIGRRAAQGVEAQWKRDMALARSPDLLSEKPDSTDVLSLEGEADEDAALKTDVSALVEATRHKDTAAYDAMLKAAIAKSDAKLAAFEASQRLDAGAVSADLAGADNVFSGSGQGSAHQKGNAVREAMKSAQRIEKQLHIRFDRRGHVDHVATPSPPRHGKHYIAGLGNIHKDNGLIAGLFKHHRVAASKVQAMAARETAVRAQSKRTHARLTDHAVFKPKGVRRAVSTSIEPSAWGLVHNEATDVVAEGSSVGKDLAGVVDAVGDVTSDLTSGLTQQADSRDANSPSSANSLWRYV